MAGRKAHIDSSKFQEFMDSIPEDGRGAGYWKVKRESPVSVGGGVVQSIIGFIEFRPGETYDELRARIKEMAEQKGPGVYFALPCDQSKKEIKDLDMGRFEFKESEVPMPEPPNQPNPMEETIKMVKNAAKDMNQLQQMEYQKRIMEKFLGGEKKEDEVKENSSGAGGISDVLLWQSLMKDSGEKKSSSQEVLSTVTSIVDSKLAAGLADLKGLVTTMQAQMQMMQNKPQDNSRLEHLIERLTENMMRPAQPTASAFQEMMLLMQKQTEDREKARLEEERRREEARREELRRTEESRKEDQRRAEEDRRRIEEAKKEESKSRDDERKRFEAERLAEERKHEEERKAEERRREEERKEERRRYDEQMRLERERFQNEVTEQRRRYDEELKIRREEMKQEEERRRLSSGEQQKYQLQLFELIKDNKNSGLEITSKVVDTLTAAGITSMKTAQDAAETIMAVAKKAGPNGDKEKGGFGDVIKDVAAVAAPLLAPYAEADARLKMFQQASRSAARKRPQEQAQVNQPNPAAQAAAQQQAQMREQQAAMEAAQAQQQNQNGMAGVEQGSGQETTTEPKEGSMIARYLQAYPILKEALLANLEDKIGADAFVPVITGLDQETLEGLLANLPHTAVMRYVKEVCNDAEKKLIDANEAWFKDFRKAMIDLVRSEDEDEEEEEEAGEEGGEESGPEQKAPAPPPAKKK